jgi:hypothetical protein
MNDNMRDKKECVKALCNDFEQADKIIQDPDFNNEAPNNKVSIFAMPSQK